MRQSVLIFCGLCLVTGAAMAAPSQAELKKIEAQIALEKQQSVENKQKSDEMKSEIQKVQRQMVSSAKDIQQQEGSLSKLEKQLNDLNMQTQELEDKLGLKDTQMVEVVTGLQTLALRPRELLFINPKNPIDTVRSQALMYASIPAIGKETEKIRQDLINLNELKTATQKKAVQVKNQTQKLTEQTEQMDRLLKQKSVLQAQYDVQYEQARRRAGQLAGQANDLKDLLNKLELERQQQQAEKMKRAYLSSPRIRAEQPVPTIASNAVSGSFEKSHGSLLYPVRGTIVAGYGDAMAGGVTSKGISIQTRSGAKVIAPFDGTVLFSGPFKGYGQLLILDHNNGYYSLIAGMQDIYATLGQELLAGEPIGQMKPVTSNLYIEIRKDGTAINPKPWFVPVM